MKVTVDTSQMKDLLAMLDKFPPLVLARGGPLDNAVRKASNVIAKRARQLAPNSSKTGTKNKQSKKSRAIWSHQVRKMVRTKVFRKPQAAVGIVGPKAPEGNAAHFLQETPRKHVLWGKATRVKRLRIARNWITQAFDETKSQQFDAMAVSLRADMDKVMRGG